MESFGQRLKNLRKAAGLTQEQLAEQLCVSFQAVSKWENDQTNPDLSLILPLAKALSVSTDLLLGACTEQTDKELNARFLDFAVKNDEVGALSVAEEAVRLFPSDPSWLFRRAICEHRLFNDTADTAQKEHYGALAEAHYRAIYEKALEQRAQGGLSVDSAGEHLCSILSARGKKQEAKEIAFKISGKCRDRALKDCLEGEEKQRHHHHTILMAALQLRDELVSDGSEEAYRLALRFVDLICPLPSISYYQHRRYIHSRFAIRLLEEGKADEALPMFEEFLHSAHSEALLYEEQKENCLYGNIFFDRYPVKSGLKEEYKHYGNALASELHFAKRILSLTSDPRFEETFQKYQRICDDLPKYSEE